jgi:hypothetical protein
MPVLIPNDPRWAKRRVTVSAPEEWRGSRELARKLGGPIALPEGLRGEWLDVYQSFNGLCGLEIKVVHDDERADIELYGVAELPAEIDGDKVVAGYAAYEDGRELPVLELAVADREETYRLAIETHEGLHSLKLKHAPTHARSIMVPGLLRPGESFYRTEPGADDVAALRRLYGPPRSRG